MSAALLNASAITGLRTGAAGALGIKWLARKDAQNLLVAGAGHQSSYQVTAALAACPSLTHVEVWDPRTSDAQITVFDTSGIAVQDLASSKVAYEHAVEAGLGVTVEL